MSIQKDEKFFHLSSRLVFIIFSFFTLYPKIFRFFLPDDLIQCVLRFLDPASVFFRNIFRFYFFHDLLQFPDRRLNLCLFFSGQFFFLLRKILLSLVNAALCLIVNINGFFLFLILALIRSGFFHCPFYLFFFHLCICRARS